MHRDYTTPACLGFLDTVTQMWSFLFTSRCPRRPRQVRRWRNRKRFCSKFCQCKCSFSDKEKRFSNNGSSCSTSRTLTCPRVVTISTSSQRDQLLQLLLQLLLRTGRQIHKLKSKVGTRRLYYKTFYGRNLRIFVISVFPWVGSGLTCKH